MAVFQLIILLLLAGAVLSAWSRRMNVPYPALLALAGAGLALLPHAPTVNLDPELALALFVAPVLLDAAYDSSPRDLRQNWRPVAGLALGAVALDASRPWRSWRAGWSPASRWPRRWPLAPSSPRPTRRQRWRCSGISGLPTGCW